MTRSHFAAAAILLASLCLTFPGVQSAQASPCAGIAPDIMCEEFEYEDSGGGNDQAAFLSLWPNALGCGANNKVDDTSTRLLDGSHSLQGPKEASLGAGSGHNRRDLIPLIAALDPSANAVQGTDANPLELWFAIDLTTNGAQFELTRYVELSFHNDLAPIVTTTQVCTESVSWPKVNPDGDGQVHASFAVGVMAYLDDDPCTVGSARPQAHQLAVYDGRSWRLLKGGFYGLTSDIPIGTRWHYIHAIIKSGVVTLEITNGGVERIVNIPRQYAGPFNKVSIGNGGCLNAIKSSWIDSLAVYNGVKVFESAPTGACCMGTGGCDEVSEADCAGGGGTYFGDFTTCANDGQSCCPDPFADSDGDTDVDMDDFAKLQRCYDADGGLPNECLCFDTDANGTVDSVDVDRFTQCGSGPGVTANAACDDAF